MYEVEVKVRADHEAVRERIGARNVRFRETVTQEDTYYDAPQRSFADTDEALRIRRETTIETGNRHGSGADESSQGNGGEEGKGDGRDNLDGRDGRNGDERIVLTYKGPLVDSQSKTRREAETGVEDADELRDVLSALGFAPAATVRKERSVYTGTDAGDDGDDGDGGDGGDGGNGDDSHDGEYTVVLDRVEGIGEFVEVELEAPENRIDTARERVYGMLRDLGLDPNAQVRTSYLELCLDAEGTEA
ncbi:class IV adenylate cyclase [Halobacteriales archaeon QS_8_65_32]|nr:MAG: class IV adenylate cyclase [Halobacteriales archaeon QS_8_65_32]